MQYNIHERAKDLTIMLQGGTRTVSSPLEIPVGSGVQYLAQAVREEDNIAYTKNESHDHTDFRILNVQALSSETEI